MNILIIGSGGREHALAWCAAQSPDSETVFVAPGNAGTAGEPGVENVAISANDLDGLLNFAREKGAWSLNLYFLVQTGRGQQMSDLAPEQTEAMLSYLVGEQDKHRPMLVRSKCAGV